MPSLAIANPTSPSPALSGAVAVQPVPPKPQETTTLAALFATEESGLLRYALGIVRRRTVAEELVQEAFLRLHQSWGDVENPRAWLYRSVRNLAINHLRDHARETDLPEEPATPDAALPVDRLEHHETVGSMRLLLAELPAEDRDLIRLKYQDGLKYDEISRRTGLSVGNVGYRLHHLLKGLADGLRRAGVEGSRG